jgi:hypothetical protein
VEDILQWAKRISTETSHWQDFVTNHISQLFHPNIILIQTVNFPEICDLHMFTDSLLHPINLRDAGGNNHAVIDMHKDDCDIRSRYLEENTLVHVTVQKSEVINQDFTQMLVPLTYRLLESIQHLPQVADLEGMSRINKTRRLMHVNDLSASC